MRNNAESKVSYWTNVRRTQCQNRVLQLPPREPPIWLWGELPPLLPCDRHCLLRPPLLPDPPPPRLSSVPPPEPYPLRVETLSEGVEKWCWRRAVDREQPARWSWSALKPPIQNAIASLVPNWSQRQPPVCWGILLWCKSIALNASLL